MARPRSFPGVSAVPQCQTQKKGANGWPRSGDRLTAFSVPNRGSGRVGALQPKLNDDQRAQTVTGLACNARSSREAPVCVSRIWRKPPAGTARAVTGSAASLLEVPGFFSCQE